jgi:uncharacterized protein YfaS (alpha-2-macroglobulin family)
MTFASSSLLDAREAMDYILKYPYGCVEQTTSSLLPWVKVKTLRRVLPDLRKTDEEVASALQAGVDRLLSMQTASGGLAYWPGGREPQLWGSTYGGMGLVLAANAGARVPEERLEQLCKYLADQLKSDSKSAREERAVHMAKACYTLALAGRPAHGYHEILFDRRETLSGEARAVLALALAETGDQTTMAKTLLNEESSERKEWEYWLGNSFRHSVEVMAWNQLAPNGAEVTAASQELLALRTQRGDWGCTSNNAWAVLALGSVADKDEQDGKVLAECTVRWGSIEQPIDWEVMGNSAEMTLPITEENCRMPLEIVAGDGTTAYVNMRIENRPQKLDEERLDRGYRIKRKYEEVHPDGSLLPADDLAVGDLVLVSLDIEADHSAVYLAVDDPLPAVLEAINPAFKSRASMNQTSSNWRWWVADRRETRTDRVLFFCNWLREGGNYHLEYLARVIGEGEATAPPAKIEEMYHPQRHGLSLTHKFVIGEPLPNDEPGKVAMHEQSAKR